MNLERSFALASSGRLYPSIILHGGSEGARAAAAIRFAQTLLCEREAPERPCGRCRHCLRIVLPAGADAAAAADTGEGSGAGRGKGAPDSFHPDFFWLVRDLKTSVSAEATREMLRSAQLSPYEARGQVFVLAEAGSLSAEASDALLKAIEEPGLRSPRNFILLAASRLDLSPTLRSRSLSVYLGSAAAFPDALVEGISAGFRASVQRFAAGGGALWLLDAASRLDPVGKQTKEEKDDRRKRLAAGVSDEPEGFDDPRAQRPWMLAATAVQRAAGESVGGEPLSPETRRRMLALAEELLTSSNLRLRGIPADRILEGLVARHLAG
ncbi:MAG: hypothetical protein ABI639_01370 [Thermoanaerobaculia bacterium]